MSDSTKSYSTTVCSSLACETGDPEAGRGGLPEPQVPGRELVREGDARVRGAPRLRPPQLPARRVPRDRQERETQRSVNVTVCVTSLSQTDNVVVQVMTKIFHLFIH